MSGTTPAHVSVCYSNRCSHPTSDNAHKDQPNSQPATKPKVAKDSAHTRTLRPPHVLPQHHTCMKFKVPAILAR